MKYEFIEAEKAGPVSVTRLCSGLGVSRSNYYAWRASKRRTVSSRQRENAELTERILDIHRESKKTYGRPRILQVLRAEGRRVGANRVRRIMLQNGIYGRKRRAYRRYGVRCAGPPAPNVLERNFRASTADQVWCGDITEFRIGRRRLYVAVVIDLFSRRVVGLAFGPNATANLTVRAMLDAFRRRGPTWGTLFHSDQGVQYRAERFRRLLANRGLRQSMSRAGNCLDNAVAESFFATLEHELASRSTWTSLAEAESDIRDFVLNFYNRERLHSTLGYLSPTTYEAMAAA